MKGLAVLWTGNLGPWSVRIEHDGESIFTSYSSGRKDAQWQPCPHDMGNGAIERYIQDMARAALSKSKKGGKPKPDVEYYAGQVSEAFEELVDWRVVCPTDLGDSASYHLERGFEAVDRLVKMLHHRLGIKYIDGSPRGASDLTEFMEAFLGLLDDGVGTPQPSECVMNDSD